MSVRSNIAVENLMDKFLSFAHAHSGQDYEKRFNECLEYLHSPAFIANDTEGMGPHVVADIEKNLVGEGWANKLHRLLVEAEDIRSTAAIGWY